MDDEKVRMIDRLLCELYEAVLAPRGFQSFLELLAEVFRLKGVVLLMRQVHTQDVMGAWQHGVEQVWMERYILTYARDDVLAIHLQSAQIGRFYASNLDLFDAERLAENRFFREWAAPQGISYAAASVVLREGAWQTQVFLQRSDTNGPFTREEMAQLDRLVPHLQRAVQMRQRLGALQTTQKAFAASLDTLAMPSLLFSESGAIVHRNRAAIDLMLQEGTLRELHGRLVANSLQATRRLQAQISKALCANDDAEMDKVSIVTVHRRGRFPLTTTVVPLRRHAGESMTSGALMFLFDPESKRTLSADTVRQLFGLTAAEAELAVALCSGLSVEEVAVRPVARRALSAASFAVCSPRRAPVASRIWSVFSWPARPVSSHMNPSRHSKRRCEVLIWRGCLHAEDNTRHATISANRRLGWTPNQRVISMRTASHGGCAVDRKLHGPHVERLPEQRATVPEGVTQLVAAGVAAHENDRQARPGNTRKVGERDAIHPRHRNVTQQQIHLMPFEQRQCALAALGLQGPMADSGQQFYKGLSNLGVVVDNQDCPRNR